jgi:hypothetical protein
MKPITLLVEARAILDRDGWCKRELHTGGKHCAIGAMEKVERDPFGGGYVLALDALNRAAKELFPDRVDGATGFHPITQVNDRKQTVYDDVCRVFDRAIQIRKEAGTL